MARPLSPRRPRPRPRLTFAPTVEFPPKLRRPLRITPRTPMPDAPPGRATDHRAPLRQLAPLPPTRGVAPAHPRAETPPPAATVPEPVDRPLPAPSGYRDTRTPEGTEPPGSPCQGPRPPVPPCPRHFPATHRFRITGRHPSGPGPWGLFIDSPTTFGWSHGRQQYMVLEIAVGGLFNMGRSVHGVFA